MGNHRTVQTCPISMQHINVFAFPYFILKYYQVNKDCTKEIFN